uniref:Uncharacterized protein n=1 Tax=Neolamprologus brichardi TaxID=32507 RepID=A0A3Q4H4A2_NEOBR
MAFLTCLSPVILSSKTRGLFTMFKRPTCRVVNCSLMSVRGTLDGKACSLEISETYPRLPMSRTIDIYFNYILYKNSINSISAKSQQKSLEGALYCKQALGNNGKEKLQLNRKKPPTEAGCHLQNCSVRVHGHNILVICK